MTPSMELDRFVGLFEHDEILTSADLPSQAAD